MRDFRDAKTMAQTLREELAAQGHKVRVGTSLELIAHVFGAADWNTLAAAIEEATAREAPKARSTGPFLPGARGPLVELSDLADVIYHRAIDYAQDRGHWGLLGREHVLLAALDDLDARKMLEDCEVDLEGLRSELIEHLGTLPSRTLEETPQCDRSWNFGFITNAAISGAAGLGHKWVTGAHLVWEIGFHSDSVAGRCLLHRGFNFLRASNYMIFGSANLGVQKTDELRETWSRALQSSLAFNRRMTPEDLLYALTDDPDAAKAFRDLKIDISALRSVLTDFLNGLPAEWADDERPSMRYTDVWGGSMDVAVTIAAEDRQRSVTGTHLLLAILFERTSYAATLLKSRGLDFENTKALFAPNATNVN